MTEFTSEEERFQWLHEMQVLIGIGFAEEQAVSLICLRKGHPQDPSFTKSLLIEYARARVQQRHMPRLSAWAIPSIVAKYPISEDAAIERRRVEILQACAGAMKPEGLKPRTTPRLE